MKITQIRNATLKLEYGGVRFLIDPMLADKGTFEGFPDTPRSHLRNPLVDLPMTIEDIINVDVVIVTHTHIDHWDEKAQQSIKKSQLIYTQHEQDAALLRAQQFENVHVLDKKTEVFGITIFKTDGQHGSNDAYAIPQAAELLGDACGLVFKHADEKTLYIAGDTIWVKPVIVSLHNYHPDVVVINAGFANINGLGPIIMGKEDFIRVNKILPEATLIASHMEAVNHCILSREELREYAEEHGIQDRVLIPADGESLRF
ncbi:MBL fold metallo-hydrolase [Franconibacter daqui]|uniref:MBL fold metallo-hydrolase n=1 Tax=Franconibacter daqui TaxID=2047724 RepID=UPI002DBEA99F|nr:MBL fold metallo-hydrolase [Franconibacter daqui]MEB5924768.1 MBL fold metallo-hydrolase [Franconibacter daqui]